MGDQAIRMPIDLDWQTVCKAEIEHSIHRERGRVSVIQRHQSMCLLMGRQFEWFSKVWAEQAGEGAKRNGFDPT